MPLPLLILGGLAAASALSKSDGKKSVSFKAKKKVKEPVKVGFKTKSGKAVSFRAKKAVTKTVPVSFRAKKKKK